MTSANELLEQVLTAVNFQASIEAKNDLLLLLVDHYNDRTPVDKIVHSVCDHLEIDRSEYAYQLKQILEPHFSR